MTLPTTPATPLTHTPILDHGFVELWNVLGADQTVAASARVSLSRELASLTDHSDKQAERDRGLINRLMRDRHTSPFESVVFQWRVRAPIFVARQWFRHRFSCLAGDTVISVLNVNGVATKALSRTVEHLWRLWSEGEVNGHARVAAYVHAKEQMLSGVSLNQASQDCSVNKSKLADYMRGVWIPREKRSAKSRVRNMKLRVLNEETGEFTSGHVEAIVASGVKPVYRVSLEGGYTIKMTAEHRVYTLDGWQTLREAVQLVGEREAAVATCEAFFMVNGVPLYKEKEKSNFWRGGVTTERASIGAWTTMVAPHVHARFGYTCQICHKRSSRLHAHHAIPVWLNPELAMEFGNLVSVCETCHRQLHQDRDAELGFANTWQPELGLDPAMFPVKVGQRLKAHAKKVIAVEYVGEEPTYDLVMQGPWHNFVANGIVVHNSFNEESGRYVELQDEFYAPDQLRVRVGKAMDYQYVDMPAEQNAQFRARIEALYHDARALYEEMLAAGVAREHARIVLPVAQYTTFIWTVNALSLMNFLHLRNSPHAQAEIRAYAQAMEAVFAERLPWTHAAFREHWGAGMV